MTHLDNFISYTTLGAHILWSNCCPLLPYSMSLLSDFFFVTEDQNHWVNPSSQWELCGNNSRRRRPRGRGSNPLTKNHQNDSVKLFSPKTTTTTVPFRAARVLMGQACHQKIDGSIPKTKIPWCDVFWTSWKTALHQFFCMLTLKINK